LFAHSLAAAHGWPLGLGPQLPLTQNWPGWQSPSPVQRTLHAPSAQRYGPQLWTTAGRHVPAPSQVPGCVTSSSPHTGGEQIVSAGYLAQAPKPSQVPVWLQLVRPWFTQMPRASRVPASVDQQVPRRPTWLHDTQGPSQATLQQTPSAQWLDAHSLSAAHTAARGFLPQLPSWHLPPLAQSLSAWQAAKQAPAVGSQPNGAQMVAGPGLQAPSPSQM
jgi:hypothetical protein